MPRPILGVEEQAVCESSDAELANSEPRQWGKVVTRRPVAVLVVCAVGLFGLAHLGHASSQAQLRKSELFNPRNDELSLYAKHRARVKIDFYGQAGCPHCFRFMVGALNKTLTDPSLAGTVDFEYFPFGNAYFVTSKCNGEGQYDVQARRCYDRECGRTATTRQDDCFGPGQLVCQNGRLECDADRYVACAKLHTRNDFKKYLPYTMCIDNLFAKGEFNAHAASTCATRTGLDFEPIQSCFLGSEGDDAVKTSAMATPAHTYCPAVVVDTEMLEWGTEDDILSIVCKKFTASPKPAACTDSALSYKWS